MENAKACRPRQGRWKHLARGSSREAATLRRQHLRSSSRTWITPNKVWGRAPEDEDTEPENTFRRFCYVDPGEHFRDCLNARPRRADVSAGDLSFVSPRAPDPAGSPLIAVVDDDDDVRAALEGLLGSLGYRAALFASVDSFLGAQRLDEVTCIISDVQMPGKSGLKLAEEVKAHATPIILITAFPSPEVEQRAKAAGVNRLLIKPFESTELISQLSKLAVHQGTAEPVPL